MQNWPSHNITLSRLRPTTIDAIDVRAMGIYVPAVFLTWLLSSLSNLANNSGEDGIVASIYEVSGKVFRKPPPCKIGWKEIMQWHLQKYPPSQKLPLIVTISLARSRFLSCYTSHGTLTPCAKLPYSPLVMRLLRRKVLQIEFLGGDESRICKNPFCKWNLLFLKPSAMAFR